MDHLRKALEKADAEMAPTSAASSHSVRDWMQPARANFTEPQSLNISKSRIVSTDESAYVSNRLIAASDDNPAILDRYRLLRTRVQQILKSRNWCILGVTSSAPEAGKTLTTLNLGITIARTENQHVIIVDSDLRKPSAAQILGLQPEYGLADYLRGSVELAQVLYQPKEFENLFLIPGIGSLSEVAKNPSELLSSPRFDTLTKTLRTTGAVILIDTPPLLVGDDVLAIAPRVDCFLLVIEEGKSTAEELKDAARLLRDHNLIGTVLNKSSVPPKRFQGYYASSEPKETSNQ